MNLKSQISNWLLALALIFGVVACAPLRPGADPIVVRAEQTISGATDTVDLFLKLEYDNIDYVRSHLPAVHRFAETLREPVTYNGRTMPRGLSYLRSATAAKDAYKRNRTTENKANLLTALAVVSTMLRETEAHLKEIH